MLLTTAIITISFQQQHIENFKDKTEHDVYQLSKELETQLQKPLYATESLKQLVFLERSAMKNQMLRNILNSNDALASAGVIDRVPREELSYYLNNEIPVKSSGNNDVLYVIESMEPEHHFGWSAGLDLGSDTSLKQLLDGAVSSYELTLLTSLSSPSIRTNSLIYLAPISNIEKRILYPSNPEKSLSGILFIQAKLNRLLELPIKESRHFQIHFDIRHRQDAPILKTYVDSADLSSRDVWSKDIKIGNQTIQINYYIKRAGFSPAAWLSLLGGMLLAVFATMTYWLMSSSRERALSEARTMTRDLNRLATIAKHTSNSVMMMDSNWNITWVNDGFTRITGYAPEEVIGKSPSQVLSSGESETSVKLITEAMRQKRGCRVEIANRRKDGKLYWVDTDVQPMHDEQGNHIGFIEMSLDITQSKMIETRIQLANAGANEGLWDWDIANNTNYYSPRFMELLGYSDPQEFHRVYDFKQSLHPDDAEIAIAEIRRHLYEHTASMDMECRLKTKDGTYRWFHGRGLAMWNKEGKPIRFAGHIVDITERRNLKRRLQEQNKHLNAIIEHIPAGITVVDANMQVTHRNSLFMRMLDFPTAWDKEDVIPFERFIRYNAARGEYGEIDEEGILEILNNAREQKFHQFQRTRPNGVSLDIRGAPIPWGGFVTTYVDVTAAKQTELELRAAKDAAEQASQAKTQFLANMSHEIRTPMNAIIGMLNLLAHTEINQRQLDYVRKTETATHNLLGILNDILDFSKVEAGKLVLDPQEVSTIEFFSELGDLFSGSHHEHVELRWIIDPNLPSSLYVDPLRLKQIFTNLLGNAIKFTDKGTIHLEVKLLTLAANQLTIECRVADTGIGIAPENQKKIFVGFEQAQASTTREFGGTGLGLAISHRLLKLMGAELNLKSELGKGSTFSFQLTLDNLDVPSIGQRHSLSHISPMFLKGDNSFLLSQWREEGQAYGITWTTEPSSAHTIIWDVSQQAIAEEPSEPGNYILLVTPEQRLWMEQTFAWWSRLQTLPCILADLAVNSVQNSQVPILSLQGCTLLVVEDNLVNQQVAKELLETVHAKVDLANDGQEALDLLQRSEDCPYHAILMDMQMPRLDGLDATRAIRALPHSWAKNVPIIAMTANALSADKQRCLDAGMSDYVSKPFSLLNVAQVIHDNITHAQTSPANTNAQEGMPGQTPSPSMEPKLLNEEDALARFSGNATLWNKITHQALLDIPPRLDELMAEGSLPLQRIQDQLHSIKGVASTVGWEQLQYACAALENGLEAIPWNPNTHGAQLMEIWRQSARAARELLTPVVVQRDVARAKELLLELLTLMDNNDMQMFEISDLLATCLEDKEVSDLQEKVNQMQLLEAATLAKQLYRQLTKEK